MLCSLYLLEVGACEEIQLSLSVQRSLNIKEQNSWVTKFIIVVCNICMYIAWGKIAPFTVGSVVVRGLDIFRIVSEWHCVVGRRTGTLYRRGWPTDYTGRTPERETEILPRRSGESRNTRAARGKQRNCWVTKDLYVGSVPISVSFISIYVWSVQKTDGWFRFCRKEVL